MFNTFFTNIGNELANKINYSGTKDFTYYLRNRQNQKFTLNEVNEQTVTRIIENLPAKNSCGYDDISSIFLKRITTSIIKPLTSLYFESNKLFLIANMVFDRTVPLSKPLSN